MRTALAALLLVFLACVEREAAGRRPVNEPSRGGTTARDSADCNPDWRQIEPGLRYRDHCHNHVPALHVVEIDPASWTLDALRTEPATAPAAARAADAPFAINANFFDPERKTLGVVVSKGEIVQRPHPVSWQSIFYVNRDGRPAIILPERWSGVSGDAATAVQAGPRIVVDGAANDVRRGDPSLRSGVCIAEDRLLFFATSGGRFYDVHEIAALAASAEDEGGLGCRDAMLFDGGPSAQIHLEGVVSLEGDRVPAFIVARPRA